MLYRFDAPIFFANAALLRDEVLAHVDRSRAGDGPGRTGMGEAATPVRTVVLDMESVHDVAQILGELLDALDQRGVTLEMARVRGELGDELTVGRIEERLGPGRIHLEVDDAVHAFLQRSGDEPADPEASEPNHPRRPHPSRPIRADPSEPNHSA